MSLENAVGTCATCRSTVFQVLFHTLIDYFCF